MIVSMNLTACSDDDEILFTVQASMPYFHENLYVPNENGNKAISNTKIRINDYDCENHIRNGQKRLARLVGTRTQKSFRLLQRRKRSSSSSLLRWQLSSKTL